MPDRIVVLTKKIFTSSIKSLIMKSLLIVALVAGIAGAITLINIADRVRKNQATVS
jgi:hypothetical protein